MQQRCPLRRLVRGPRDNPGAHRVRSRNEVFIDVVHMLPQIFGASGAERGDGIDVPRDLEHPAPHGREDLLYCPDDSMVERMNRAFGRGFAYTPHDERLDVARLYLNEYTGSRSYLLECFREGRDPGSRSKQMRSDLLGSAGCNPSPSASRHISRVEDGIVMNYDYPIRRSVDIELDCLRPQLDRPLERRNGVFGQGVVRAAVGDREGTGRPAVDQVLLWGFGWERAEPADSCERGKSALTAGVPVRLPNEPG